MAAPQHQHHLLGVLLHRHQLRPAAAGRAGAGHRRKGGPGVGCLALVCHFQQIPHRLGRLARHHQHGPLRAEPGGGLHQPGPLHGSELVVHPQWVVAVAALAIELAAQQIVGLLERIFLLAGEGLQVELPLKAELIRRQPGAAHHRVQQRQHGGGISCGALEADHQSVFAGLTAQLIAKAPQPDRRLPRH